LPFILNLLFEYNLCCTSRCGVFISFRVLIMCLFSGS